MREADEGDVERLSIAVARQLDESLGEHRRTYTFTQQAPADRAAAGYHVYRAGAAGREEDNSLVYNGEDEAIIEFVEAHYPYVGFVRSYTGTEDVD